MRPGRALTALIEAVNTLDRYRSGLRTPADKMRYTRLRAKILRGADGVTYEDAEWLAEQIRVCATKGCDDTDPKGPDDMSH